MKKTIYLHDIHDYNVIEKFEYNDIKALSKEFKL